MTNLQIASGHEILVWIGLSDCLVNSLIPVEFKKFIMEAVSKSEEKYSAKTRDEIEVTAEFAKLFSDSATYSSYLILS